MNLFTTFYTFIQNSVLNMVSAVTNDISASIAPAVVTFATIYVMIWGYLHLRGAIEEPVMEGAKRILLLAVILAVCLDLWEYNAVFIDFFVNTPTALSGHPGRQYRHDHRGRNMGQGGGGSWFAYRSRRLF